MRAASTAILAAVGLMIILMQSPTAQASEIRIVATPSLSTTLAELGPAFEHATGNRLAITYGLVVAQKKKIESGDFDLALVPEFVVDAEIKQGKVAADSRAVVARAALGVGVRAGAIKPDFGSMDGFKNALLKARSVTYVVHEPTGMHVTNSFERLGIADQMKAKTIDQKSVKQVWEAVAKGDAELGFGFTSNLLAVRGVELAGRFPPELQFFTTIAAGMSVATAQANAARALVAYLKTPQANLVLNAKGFEPLPAP